MAQTERTQKSYNIDISNDVAVLKSQMLEMKQQQDRIENKIDHWVSVSPADFLVYRSDIEKILALKADKSKVDLIQKIVFAACGIILAAVLYTALSSIGIKTR
jgi:hypothetical protein